MPTWYIVFSIMVFLLGMFAFDYFTSFIVRALKDYEPKKD